jgi:broad specificity phosphatase PhoE
VLPLVLLCLLLLLHLQLKEDVQKFDTLYVSPLTRATQTADIITTGMGLRSVTLPSLREIDLYSFQVIIKE